MESIKEARSYWENILSPIIRNAVREELAALPKLSPSQPANNPDPPFINSEQTKAITGWPDSTFRAKIRQMPEGIVIRKSKRLLLDRQKFLTWLTDGKGLTNE